jgi:hypothetical protein
MVRTYKVTRFFHHGKPNRVVKRGLTLEEAQEHCSDPETSSSTALGTTALKRTKLFGPWFDEYEME